MTLITNDLTRRGFSAGGVGLCAVASAAAAPVTDLLMKGRTTRSESVHSGVASADGRYQLTTRLCRYPELGRAWVWAHLRTPSGFYAFTDHQALCGPEPTALETEHALYRPLALEQTFERSGPRASPRACTVSGRLAAHRGEAALHGPGSERLSFKTAFSPLSNFAGLLEGRTEVFGRGRCSLTLNGRKIDFEGPAQWHEQVQTAPRFVTPFCYATLWSAEGGATFLISPQGRGGYIATGPGAVKATTVRIDPPGAGSRSVLLKLEDGRALSGAATVLSRYAILAQGELWRGHMVSLDLDGRRYFGHINDFRPEGVPYLA